MRRACPSRCGVVWPHGRTDRPCIGSAGANVGARVGDVLSGAAWGTVGAKAMTGMRVITTELGLVRSAGSERAGSARYWGERRVSSVAGSSWRLTGPSAQLARRHSVRCQARCEAVVGAGPVYGLRGGVGFELGIAPVRASVRPSVSGPVDRLALAADHLLFGLLLSGTPSTERSMLCEVTRPAPSDSGDVGCFCSCLVNGSQASDRKMGG